MRGTRTHARSIPVTDQRELATSSVPIFQRKRERERKIHKGGRAPFVAVRASPPQPHRNAADTGPPRRTLF
ncbi:hypothetical protein EVAR_75840_1 [Eumeta japonica]|uniref:Uncharacterized protein n=1 Tax=Eumeta variegata TaxID=151549 RepID=A0A4C1TG86_EUMVA|nr:hypothetical protein EVAR_75840_1 [Eumeta japonica]